MTSLQDTLVLFTQLKCCMISESDYTDGIQDYYSLCVSKMTCIQTYVCQLSNITEAIYIYNYRSSLEVAFHVPVLQGIWSGFLYNEKLCLCKQFLSETYS